MSGVTRAELRGATREEVLAAQEEYREACRVGDWDAAILHFTEDVVTGNNVRGLYHGRAGAREWIAASPWIRLSPTNWGYALVWEAVDVETAEPRLLTKWKHWLPEHRPDGSPYEFEGITEKLYAGDGQFSFNYSVLDVVGLHRIEAEAIADGRLSKFKLGGPHLG
jgi:hypothetical protein